MTGNMNATQVRVVDPILSTVAQGYQHPEFVGRFLFPRVPVNISGGRILEFGIESFKTYNLRRAPGAGTTRITFGYLGKPYALVQDSLEVPVPREHMRDAKVMPGVELGTRATNMGMKTVTRGLESEQAAIAINAANYDTNHKVALSGGTKWSADTGKPTSDIEAAKNAIRASTGQYPNVCLLSATAFEACKANPQIIERIKYTGRDSVTTEILSHLWEIDNVVVGKGIEASDAGVFSDIWGNNVVLGYVPQNPSGMEEPSYGYTYTMEGHPLVEQAYYDNNAKSWIYGVTMERAPVLTGMAAGFLIQNPK